MLEQLVYRDAPEIESVRSPESLLRLVRAVGLNTGGLPTESNLAAAGGVDVRTARRYLDLLEDLRIVDRVPAWHNSQLTRLLKAPKFYLTDAGMASSVLGLDVQALLRSGNSLARLIETFVAAQLRPLLGLGSASYSMTHARDRGGDHEVDIVLENRGGQVIGIEVKAADRATAHDARHLAWLRDRMGDRMLRGIVLHTGRSAYPLGAGIVAMPIATLWSWPSSTTS